MLFNQDSKTQSPDPSSDSKPTSIAPSAGPASAPQDLGFSDADVRKWRLPKNFLEEASAFSQRSRGFSGFIKTSCSNFIAKHSINAAKYWLTITRAGQADRADVAFNLIDRQGKSRVDIFDALGIDALEYAKGICTSSAVESFKVLKEFAINNPALEEKFLSIALARAEEGAIDLVDKESVPDKDSALRLWSLLADRDPLTALCQRVRFNSLPVAAVQATLDRAIELNPLITVEKLRILPELDPNQNERLAKRVADADFQVFKIHKNALKVTQHDMGLIGIGLATKDPRILLSNLWEFDEIDQDQKAKILSDLFARETYDSLEHLTELIEWSQGTLRIPDTIGVETLSKFWKRILANREVLDFRDPQKIKEIVDARVSKNPSKLIESLPELRLASQALASNLALTLATKCPQNTKFIATHLEITNTALLSKLLGIYVSFDLNAALSWANTANIPISRELHETIFEIKVKSKPWKTLKDMLQTGQSDPRLLLKVISICVSLNASRVAREIAGFSNVSAQVREHAFVKCSEVNLWGTVKYAGIFNIAGSAGARKVFHKAAVRDPIRALGVLAELGIFERKDIRHVLLNAVSKNSKKTVEFLKHLDLDAELKGEISIIALRRNPQLLEAVKPLVRDMTEDRKVSIAAVVAGGDILRATQFLQKIVTSSINSRLLVSACAMENFQRAELSARGRDLEILHDAQFLAQLTPFAVLRGRWDSSLAITKAFLHLSNPDLEAVSMAAALQSLDGIASEIVRRDDLSDSESENTKLFIRIRKAQCIPTDLIQKTLDHFGPDDYDFIFNILDQGGSTMAETTCDVLLNAYQADVDILPVDQKIIGECLRIGFRGLSPRMLQRLRPVFEESEIEGRNALKSYYLLAEKILNGNSIDPQLEASPLYPSIVTSAYRPVGMTESSVAYMLDRVADNSKHLSPFKYEQAGYPLRLSATSTVEIRKGETVDYDCYGQLKQIMQPLEDTSKAISPPMLVKRLLQGAFDQLSSQVVWNLFRSEVNDPRIKSAEKSLEIADFAKLPLARLAKVLSDAQEAFSVVSYDAVMEIAKLSLSTDATQDKGFRIDQKAASQVRKLLRLNSERAIEAKEVLSAVDLQVAKLFRNEKQTISREAKKFTMHFGDLKERHVIYLSKSKAAYFGRAGAGLCTANELWSWNSSTFLQMIMVDTEKNRIVGNVQLHLFKNAERKAAVLARLNPTSTFLTSVDKNLLADEMLRVVRDFAVSNNLVAYLPEQTGWHQLTNRDPFAPPLVRYYGKPEKVNIRITEGHSVYLAYKLSDAPKKG